jgi:ATP-dependent DNA helicase RecG
MITEFHRLIRAGETAALEFKSTLADTRKIVETIAAMATTIGGTILVGVRPNGVSVGFEQGEGTLERLVQRVLASTDPKVFIDLDFPEVDGRRLLRIRVPPGDGPHLASGRAFYRSGPATVAMGRDEYERRLLDRLRESSGYERRLADGVGMAELDPDAVRRFLGLARLRGLVEAESPESVVRHLHLSRGDQLTVGGVLLFALSPQGPFPQATIRAHARRGASEDSAEIGGTLFKQVDEAVEFVARNLKVRPDRSGIRRVDVPELPRSAVREVVANAVAHRDYSSTAPIQIRLTDSGLTVWNPGHFPPPITAALLRTAHPSVPRNMFIARALYLAGYIEEWGTGTLRVVEAMRAQGNPEPLFEEGVRTGIRVVLPLSGVTPDDLSPRQAAILGGWTLGRSVTTAECAQSQGVAHRTALQDLRQLEQRGLIERRGRGKATRWRRL